MRPFELCFLFGWRTSRLALCKWRPYARDEPHVTKYRRAKSKIGARLGGNRLRTSRLSLELLDPRLAMTGVVINEFLASNVDGVTDQDGDHSD